MNFIYKNIPKNISFLKLTQECKTNLNLKPSSPKTKLIKKKFLDFYRKKIVNNFFVFKFDNKQKIVFPYMKMGKPSSLGLFGYHEHNIFLHYIINSQYYKKKVADIGANIGLHTIILSKLGYRVDAYEPDNEHFKILKNNLKKNNCKNVKLFNNAILNCNKHVEFVRVKGNTAANHIKGFKDNLHGKIEKFKVSAIDIKKIVNKYDLIKLDAEGSEGVIIERLNKKELNNTDIICEISGIKNAKKIFKHCRKKKANIFSQKISWSKVKKLKDLPIHHLEGLILISKNNKFDIDLKNAN